MALQAQQLNFSPDVVLATSMLDVASFQALYRDSKVPLVLYMHENQLTYPIRPGGKRDQDLVYRQFTSQLCADQIWFNSQHNLDSWFKALPLFLQRFGESHGSKTVDALESKSKVMPVGLSLPESKPSLARSNTRPILIWNQRWEWDKNTEAFVNFVKKFDSSAPFDVVILGEAASRESSERRELRDFLGSRLLHHGWCEKDQYWKWLQRADLTVSTARHEFFGISILEAVACGVYPLLPNKLSYPEIFGSACLGAENDERYLYDKPRDLFRLARDFFASSASRNTSSQEFLQELAYRYSWANLAPDYDAQLL